AAVLSSFAVGPFLQGGAAAAGAAGAAHGAGGAFAGQGLTAAELEEMGIGAGVGAGSAAATSAATTAAVTETLSKAGVARSTIQQLLRDPKTYAGLAALVPTIAGAFGG